VGPKVTRRNNSSGNVHELFNQDALDRSRTPRIILAVSFCNHQVKPRRTFMSLALAAAGRVWPWWNSGYGWPWAFLWLGFAILFWGGLIAILVWAVRSATAPRQRPDSAMEVLGRRLATGEISQEEYEHIKRLLEDTSHSVH
jgi:uncharacterized membrane protein